MEGQGKRLLLAVLLALGVYMVWMLVFPQHKSEPEPGSGSGSGSGSAVATKVVPKAPPLCTPTAEAPAPAPATPTITTLSFPGKFTAKFSTQGGSLVSWKLADPRFEKDATHGELIPSQPWTGAFQVGFWKGSTRCIPEHTDWKLDKATDTQLVYSYTRDGITLVKTFTILPDAYMVRLNLELKVTDVAAKQEVTETLALRAFAFQDPEHAKGGGRQVAARAWSSSTMRDGTLLSTPLHDLQDGPQGQPEPRYEANITWTGFEHPYLLAAYAPNTKGVAKHTYSAEPFGLMRTELEFPPLHVDQASTTKYEVVSYLGPKYYNLLSDADDAAGFPTGFKQTIDLGWFGFIGRPLMWLLLQFHGVVGNWGLAIILLTFLVKALTLYWMTKSMRSMKQMAALAPQMKALQEKYKNDKQRIQAETMALYKQHNVNPIAGCLPILLQMPIWIALYRMLSSAGELYQQPFIPGWIDDLTNTDPTYVLPVVLVVTMFAQARLTPQTGTGGQQKFLQYGMPLMFGVMSFFFPAGLTLYIFTNTVLSAVHSIYMNKYDKKSLEIAAQLKRNKEAAEAADAAKGGGGKGGDAKAKPAPKVIDAEASEIVDGDKPRATGTAPARPRPKRNNNKKRRR